MQSSVKYFLTYVICFSLVFAQDKVEVSYGSGTSTLSNVSYKVNDSYSGISYEFSIDRLTSRLKDSKLNFGGPSDIYDLSDLLAGYLEILMSQATVSANGISMNISSTQDPSESISIDLKKLMLSYNDWDIFINESFLEDDFGSLEGEMKFSLQGFSVNIGSGLRENLSTEEAAIFAIMDEILISKIDSQLSYFDNKLTYSGNLTTSLGKCTLKLTYLIPRSIYEEVYIDNFHLNITNVDDSLKPFINLMLTSTDVPFIKTGNGYSLKMTGTLNNPRYY